MQFNLNQNNHNKGNVTNTLIENNPMSQTPPAVKWPWWKWALYSVVVLFLLGGTIEVFWNLVAGHYQKNFDTQINKVETLINPAWQDK